MVSSFVLRAKNSLSGRFRNQFQKFLWSNIDAKWTLQSGLTVKIENHAEWVIYNDIFVEGEYDLPIKHALHSKSSDKILNFLDLGANVGFFTLRVADIILQQSPFNLPFKITLVEGSPAVYKKLSWRLKDQPALTNKISIVHGLVGERQGSAKIFETDFHVMNAILTDAKSKGTDVHYIDLVSLYGDEVPEIDLLKCDIEGSELSFIENYKDMLSKVVKSAVFEFHHDTYDPILCFKLLKEAGFSNHKPLRDTSTFSVHFFWK